MKNKFARIARVWLKYFYEVFIMLKCITVLIIITSLQAFSKCFGQNKINLNLQHVALKKALEEIEKQTNYRFLYKDADVDDVYTHTLDMHNAAIGDVLSLLFAGTRLTYKIDNELIIISLKQVVKTMDIAGRVTDEHGELLPGVSIKLKNSALGTVTAADGSFRIASTNQHEVLVCSYVGFKTLEVNVDGPKTLNITLEAGNHLLNEIVAIGYQNVNRRDLTSAVSSITKKELRDSPQPSAAEAIQGKLAGVQVTLSEGAPGAPADIYIRGRTSITQSGAPLYVVDGVQLENALNVLSPQDIESIDVLKDAASTSIYGARGSNGVIVITTKSGKNTNGKITVTYNNTTGIQKLPKELGVMNAFDFVEFQYERAKITGDTLVLSRYYKTGDSYNVITAYKNVPAIDWQSKLFGRNALLQTHNITVSGGDAKTQFNLSGTLNVQQGILQYTDYERRLLNLRLDHRFNAKLKLGFNVRYNSNVLNGEGTSDAGGAGSSNLRQVVRYQPVLLPGQTDDYYDAAQALATNGNGLSLINPYLALQSQYRKRTNKVFDANANITYKISKRLTLRSVVAIDLNSTTALAFDDTITANSRLNGGNKPIASITTGSTRTINNSNTLNYTYNSISGSKHNLNVLIGQETYQTYTTTNYTEYHGIPVGTTPAQEFAGNLGQLYSPPLETEVPVHNLSFFSRLSYNYAEKYFVAFNLRADASSVFGPLHKWGYFPSAALAWRISDENFMKAQNVVSDLKLRFSYGAAGNNRIPPYSFGTFFTGNKPYYLNGSFVSGTSSSGLANPGLQWETLTLANAGIDAEFFKGRLQLTVDGYRNTSGNLLLYNIVPADVGYTNQYQNVGSTQNTGLEIQLTGMVVRSKNFSWTGNFNISFNKNVIKSLGAQQQFTANSGYFNGSQQPADFLVKVGDEVGAMYGLVNDGYYKVSDFDATPYNNPLYPWATTKYTLKANVPISYISSTIIQPGTQKFKDINGDGKITTDDYTIIGHALPKFIGGFGQQFSYKSFDLSIFLKYSYGNQVANYNKLEFTSTYTNGANLLSIFNNRYRTVNPANGAQVQGVPSASVGVIGASPAVLNALNTHAQYWIPVQSVEWDNNQSFAIEDGSYLRVNNITLSYTFPKHLTERIKVSNLRVFITGNNLGTITGYSGYDPDVSTRRATPITAGVDYSAYPRSRTYALGLNASF